MKVNDYCWRVSDEIWAAGKGLHYHLLLINWYFINDRSSAAVWIKMFLIKVQFLCMKCKIWINQHCQVSRIDCESQQLTIFTLILIFHIVRFIICPFLFFPLWIPCLAEKSHHMDLTKQIGKSLQLDNYCVGDHLSAGNKLFTPHLMQWVASHFLNKHVERHISWSWKRCLRRVKSLACIKQRKYLSRLQKLLKMG